MDDNNHFYIPDYSLELCNPRAQQDYCYRLINNEDLEAAIKILNLRYVDPGNIFKNTELVLGQPKQWCILGRTVAGVSTWSNLPINEQYHAITNTAGGFIASTMQYVKISGKQSGEILDRLSPRRVSNLPINGSRFVLCTNISGTIDDEAIVIRTDSDKFVMSCGSCRIPSWLKILEPSYPDAVIEECDLCVLIIFGPKRLEAITNLIEKEYHIQILELKNFNSCTTKLITGDFARIVKTLISYEIWADENISSSIWNHIIHKNKEIVPCGWDVLNIYRLECRDIVFRLYPLDHHSGTTLWEVDGGWMFNKADNRDFIGREALLKLDGKKRFWFGGLISKKKGEVTKDKIPDIGTPIFHKSGEFAGYVTTSDFSPMHNRILMFCHLMPSCSVEEEVFVNHYEYLVSKLPF